MLVGLLLFYIYSDSPKPYCLMLVGLARASKHNKLRCADQVRAHFLSSTSELGATYCSSRGSTSPDEDQS
eukprot:SAG31_NODE_55_length_29938_cov_9.154027_18_plen_70_part_00